MLVVRVYFVEVFEYVGWRFAAVLSSHGVFRRTAAAGLSESGLR